MNSACCLGAYPVFKETMTFFVNLDTNIVIPLKTEYKASFLHCL